MSGKILAFFALTAALISDSAFAEDKNVHIGIGAGVNYAMYSGYTDDFWNPEYKTYSGWNFNGSVGLSFFQDSVLGIRVFHDFFQFKIDGGTNEYIRGKAFMTSVIPGFNFNLFGNRHSLGLGAAHIYAPSTESSRGSIAKSTFAAVLEGRDMWRVGKDNYFFLSAKIPFWTEPAGPEVMILMQLGLDF